MRRHALSLVPLVLICLSHHLYLISFTLDIHLVIQPRSLAPIPMSGQAGQAFTPERKVLFWGVGMFFSLFNVAKGEC